MLYTGYFRAMNGNTITVNITTNNSTSQQTQLTFAGESPVVINQTSSDGIFSPIKSRSCTISIVTPDAYYDMYSASSHGTSVVVTDSSRNEVLFSGYMTPCEYNQPYVYLNEIELEAVDRLSTLKDYKYVKQGSNTSLVTIRTVIVYCLRTVAGYTGGLFVPQDGLKSNYAHTQSSECPFFYEYINEDAFRMSENEMMSCYEVLEEICKFYNMSLVPLGENVYFVDYEVVKTNTTTRQSNYIRYWDQSTSPYGVTFRDLSGVVIDGSTYAGSDQNVEIDKVYNKIKIKADVVEIEDKYTEMDPVDEAEDAHYIMSVEADMQRSDGEQWTSMNRLFEYPRLSLLNQTYPWQTLVNTNIRGAVITYVLSDNFTETYNTTQYARMDFPYPNGWLFNVIPGQCCLLAQQFAYKSSDEMPYSADWTDYLMFFTQANWLYEYYVANPTHYNPSYNDQTYWLTTYYENHMGGAKPVFRYIGDKDMEWSPSDASITNYIAFTGDILWQRNGQFGNIQYDLWEEDTTNHKWAGTLYPIKDVGAPSAYCIYCYRTPATTNYNKGWDMLKIKLKIGDKYWNGSSWTTTETTAWIPYHAKNVVSDTERLNWNEWEKPVTNHNYTYGIGKEAYVIPITKADGLYGKIVFEMYMPRVPYSDNMFYGNTEPSINNMRLNYANIPPVIFMKDFGLELVSADSDTTKWYLPISEKKEKAKEEAKDDIIYENSINSNNVMEMGEISMKINSYNSKKPIADSYIVDGTMTYNTDGFYRYPTNTTNKEEYNVISRYVNHYSTPKKIYNCVVHGYVEPWKLVTATALPGTEFIVDAQEYDVKQDVNNLKLIEY